MPRKNENMLMYLCEYAVKMVVISEDPGIAQDLVAMEVFLV